MSKPTGNTQVLKMGGKPAFAVIPYDKYLQLISSADDDALISHEVVGLVVAKNINRVQARYHYREEKPTALFPPPRHLAGLTTIAEWKNSHKAAPIAAAEPTQDQGLP